MDDPGRWPIAAHRIELQFGDHVPFGGRRSKRLARRHPKCHDFTFARMAIDAGRDAENLVLD